jgi:RNA polymerase sigma-70 factor (ECF subfamily)
MRIPAVGQTAYRDRCHATIGGFSNTVKSDMGGKRGRRERDAFEEFCTYEYARLVASIELMLGDRDLAAEAVNEALARAWNRVRRGHAIDTLGAWVRVVAMNVGYDALRKRSVEVKHRGVLAISAANNTDDGGWGLSVDVRAAVAALPQRQREVAVLHYLQGLTVTAIAEELNISAGTVKTCLQRARIALSASLRELSEEACDLS